MSDLVASESVGQALMRTISRGSETFLAPPIAPPDAATTVFSGDKGVLRVLRGALQKTLAAMPTAGNHMGQLASGAGRHGSWLGVEKTTKQTNLLIQKMTWTLVANSSILTRRVYMTTYYRR